MAQNIPLPGVYDYRLVALSVLLSLLAAFAALDLAGRITFARGVRRFVWLCGGATAMGAGIWSMHYVGMEAFHLPVPVWYDWPTVLLSLLAAILASGVALVLVSRRAMGRLRTLLGSIVMGSGIAAMHYIGMAAMRLQAMCVYSASLVALSVFLAIVISYAALQLTFDARDRMDSWDRRKVGSAVAMGLAIPVMHYVGMAAVRFMPTPVIQGSMAHAVSVSSLGLAGIVFVTLMLLVLVYISSAMDRHLSIQLQFFKESRLQLQAIFDTMTEAIVVVDCDRGIAEHNRASADLFGLKSQKISMEEIAVNYEGYSPTGEMLSREQWPLLRAMHGDFCKNTAMVIRRKDTGASITVEVTTVPIATQDKSRKIILSLRDIEERMQMDKARTRLVAIVESSEDAIIGKDLRGVVTDWNAGASKIFGYSSAEMIGQSVKVLLPPGREREEDDILSRISRGERVTYIETQRKRKDGVLIDVSLTISPIRDANGKIVGASKIARDISEKKQMERQLQQSQKMDAIGQLTGGIAHDFNNLLGIIMGNLDLLEGFTADNENALDQVRTAQRAATRGADLTRRLLAFARMEGLKPASTLLNSSIENLIALAKRALGPEIAIKTQLDESLPRVFVDAAGLESALLNLVVNARDAMPNGGSIAISTHLINLEETYLPVRMEELKTGWYACLSISDTGLGMSKNTLDRAFEPFFTTKPRDKGTGLGLSMVYGFAKQSGGTVRIYSEVGKGTTVSMYLPLAETDQQQPKMAVENYALAQLKGTVLVVDDEADLLKIAAAYLSEMGLASLLAEDGASALETVQREITIDLMITDIVMPGGISGVELAQRVHELRPHIKIMYSSGFPADALAERRMSLANGPLLHKPYQRSEFQKIVRRIYDESDERPQ